MGNEKDITPPEPTKLDAFIEGVKAGFSGPGGIIGALLKSPLEKRRDNWMKDISQALLELQDKVNNFSFEDLQNNEVFISACLSATQAALRTNVVEKRVALRNAILNTAIKPDIDETIVQMFINMIDTFTAWHLKILDLYSDPNEWAKRNSKEFPSSWYMGPRSQVLDFAYPEIATQRDLYRQLIRDLYNSGLLNIDSLGGTMTRSGITDSISTNMGNEFLQFIRSPIPENNGE